MAIPNDLQTFQSARVVLIPHAPGGAASLRVIVCAAQHGTTVVGDCSAAATLPFTGVANQLVEIDVSASLASRIGTAEQTT